MDLVMTRHDTLSSLASIIIVLAPIGGAVLVLLGFVSGDWWLVAYGVSVGFGGIVASAVLEWMRSIYVALYNLNRLAQQGLQASSPPTRVP